MNSYQQWTEYDWEQWYKTNNEMAFRYLVAYMKYHDLPACDTLIEQECPGYRSILVPDVMLPPGLDGAMWIPSEAFLPPAEQMGNAEGFVPSFDENTTLQHPLCHDLIQIIGNWNNIYALLLPDHMHQEGLVVLFHLSRALTMMVYSIVDRNYPAPTAPLMLIKRCISHLSLAICGIQHVESRFAEEIDILYSLEKQILGCCDLAMEHLVYCQRQTGGFSE